MSASAVSRSVQLERLTQLSRAFTYATSLADILELAVKQAAEMLGAEKAILLLPDEQGVLHVSASHGVSRDLVDRFRDSLDESLAGRISGMIGSPISEGFVGVPLVSNGNVIGLLAVFRPAAGVATPDEEWLLSALADQVAAPLENARLTEEIEKIALISENGRLYEAERAARQEAERAREEAESARAQAVQAMTEAEKARDLAEESNRSKAAFLAAMSHDLRTPLNAIAGYVQLMKLGLRGPVTPEQDEDLDRIARNQQHLLSIISDVLEFARLGAGRVVFQKVDVSLDEILRDAEAMVTPQMVAKRIQYRFQPAGQAVSLHTDPGKLQQILLNLLSNAIKFTPEGGSITTTFETQVDGAFSDDPQVWISVSDTGDGIHADKLESIFLPFVQVARSLNHPDEGIGLGLAISRDLARGLGGDLTAVSEYGKGSTFTLTLPLR
jgi:signal transduction histidine kinase